MRCDECRFWDGLEETEYDRIDEATSPNPEIGRCRRLPPSCARAPSDVENGNVSDWMIAVWPVTWDCEWCGEFEAKAPNVGTLVMGELRTPDLGRRKLDQDMHCEFGE
jgi:hypothetical protein